jgi:hypothetical protein
MDSAERKIKQLGNDMTAIVTEAKALPAAFNRTEHLIRKLIS